MGLSIDQNLVVTGASGGIGLEMAKDLLKAGHRGIIFHYKSNGNAIKNVLKEFQLDAEKHTVSGDLTKEADVTALREAAEKRFGPTFGVIHLTGISNNAMSWKTSLEEFDRVVRVNLHSTFLVAKEFVPGMRERGHGRIINTSSVVAFSGMPGASSYCAAKAGVIGFTKALALETAGKGITANSLVLGYFEKGMIDTVPANIQETIRAKIPVGRFGRVSEISGMVMYLLSEQGAFVTGQSLQLNGGLYL